MFFAEIYMAQDSIKRFYFNSLKYILTEVEDD